MKCRHERGVLPALWCQFVQHILPRESLRKQLRKVRLACDIGITLQCVIVHTIPQVSRRYPLYACQEDTAAGAKVHTDTDVVLRSHRRIGREAWNTALTLAWGRGARTHAAKVPGGTVGCPGCCINAT